MESIGLSPTTSSSEDPSAPAAAVPEKGTSPVFLVGIGSSAGGLEALSSFLRALPRSQNRSIVIAQHLSPHARSMLTDLLARQSSAPVTTVVDGMHLTSDHVYVIPPNHDARIEGSRILLSVAGNETRPKPSVDLLFETLAASYGPRSVGIILSGTGTDGARGSAAIHAAGGLVLAQSSQTARYDGMPRATADSGVAESILAPEELGAKLDQFLDERLRLLAKGETRSQTSPYVARSTPPSDTTSLAANPRSVAPSDGPSPLLQDEADFGHDDDIVDGATFHLAIAHLKAQAGSDFTQYKESTLRRRLLRRVQAVGAQSVQSYVASLESDPVEARKLAQDLLVSVTSFFRDPEAFAALEPLVRTRALNIPPNEELRVWVAGCATGEEAYTFALMILELARSLGRPLRARIFASDIDVAAVAHARMGRYTHADIEAIPVELVERYFDFHDGMYEVIKEVRDMCVFAQQDLVQQPPFVKLDVVSCRNVLIYFNVHLQTRVIETFHYALKDAGILFLGRSESVTPDLFEPADRKARVYVRRDTGPRHLPLRFPEGVRPPGRRAVPLSLPTSLGKTSLRERAAITLLTRSGTTALVVDEDLGIVSIVGDLSPYTRLPSGDADFRAMNLVPRDLGIEMQLLVRKAARERMAVHSRPHAVPFPPSPDGAPVPALSVHTALEAEAPPPPGAPNAAFVPAFRLLVEPFPSDGPRPLYLVGFVPTRPIVQYADDAAEPNGSGAGAMERIRSLEDELADTREHLQAVVEELEVSNEELQALNEELSSTNEELQSTNEELETTNEELQSTNEELTTLNDELAVRSADLRYLNASLENVQSSIDTGLIVVDTELRVVRFNEAALSIFDLGKLDIGRSLLQASCRCEIPTLENSLRATLATGEVQELTCSTARRTFQMRALPFRDVSGRLLGVILTFFDNTELMVLKHGLEMGEQRLRAILNGAQALVSVKDAFGRYTLVNAAFLRFVGRTENDILGKTDRELFDAPTASRLRDNDLEVLLDGSPTERVEVLVSHSSEQRSFLASRFLLGGRDAGPQGVGNVSVDATEQFASSRALEENQARLMAIVEDQAVFVCRFESDGMLTFANGALLECAGWRSFSGHSFFELVDADSLEKVRADILALTTDEPVANHEIILATASQAPSPRWIRWVHRALFSAAGKVREFQSVGFDATAMHDRNRELEGKAQLFGHVLEHTADSLTVFREEAGEFILESFNRSAAKSLGGAQNGLSAARLVGLNLRELMPAHRIDFILERFRAAQRTGAAVNYEEREEAPGGMRYVSTSVFPIRDEADRVRRVAAMSRDVTRLKRTEEALREEKLKAEGANRAKSDFLAALSHELRAPLNVITSTTQLLARLELPSAPRQHVTSIDRASSALLALIEDVLDLSRIEAGKVTLERKPFFLEEIEADLLATFAAPMREKGLTFSVSLAKETGALLGDANRIRQLLVNLVGNALKFTHKGHVTVRGFRVDEGSQSVADLRFEVQDTGVGIPRAAFHKVFVRFSQVDDGVDRRGEGHLFGGSGLGLAICRELVDLMGGSIGFESTEGEGSLFWFSLTLPLSNVADAKSPGPRILVVDTNSEGVDLMRLYGMQKRWRLFFASTCDETLAVLARERIDLVLLDVQLPDVDGMETARRIRASHEPWANVPLIALTANAMQGDKEAFLNAGMNDSLTRPIDLRLLDEKIQQHSQS